MSITVALESERTPFDQAVSAEPLETMHELRRKLERYQRRRARRAGWTPRFLPTGVSRLDTCLPYGGLPCGAVTEILSAGSGVGAMSLALRLAGRAARKEWIMPHRCTSSRQEYGQTSAPVPPHDPQLSRQDGMGCRQLARGFSQNEEQPPERRDARPTPVDPPHGLIVLIDAWGDFYPPAALQHGVSLDRLIVVRPANAQDAVWAMDQTLQCSAVAAVVASLANLDERSSRRLQLAAKRSGAMGLILRPARGRAKSFAAVRILLESVPPEPASEEARCRSSPNAAPGEHRAGEPHFCRMTLLKAREGMPAKPFVLDWQHETDALPVHSLPGHGSVVKTGS